MSLPATDWNYADTLPRSRASRDVRIDVFAADPPMAVLRCLAVEFGGEATLRALRQRLGRAVEESWVRNGLQLLDGSGDVTVEACDRAGLIARITPRGAARIGR
jgi:hypothetical protein